MSTDPFAYEREEERDSERFYTGPDDPDRPDPSEYEDRLYLSERLDCGHLVEASEDSGGMDELDRVTLADVQRLLDFKIATHRCEPITTDAFGRFAGPTPITDPDGKTYAQRNHPATSHDAAEAAQPQATTDEKLCLQWIVRAGTRGALADEISAGVEDRDGRIFPPNQVASRLMGLREKGLIVRGVPADTRKTRRNVKARVHYVKGDQPIVEKESL